MKAEPSVFCFTVSPLALLCDFADCLGGMECVCVYVCTRARVFVYVQRDFMLVLLSSAPAVSHRQQKAFWMRVMKR